MSVSDLRDLRDLRDLPKTLHYDPKTKIQNFIFGEDFENIRMNLQGTNQLYVDQNFNYFLGHDKVWKRPTEICDHPYFVRNSQHDRFDAMQGQLADCWLMATISALTSNKDLIRHVAPPNQYFYHDYIGAFYFRIWQLGTWYEVVVDDRLPVLANDHSMTCYAYSRSGDVFWACLLEKAYAKVCGYSYEKLSGGISVTALQDLSGGLVEVVLTTNPPKGTTIGWFINRIFELHAFICCATFLDVRYERTDLFVRHAYSLSGIFKCSDDDPIYPGLYLLRVKNPFEVEWTGEWSDYSKRWREINQKLRKKLGIKVELDGEFWMEENEFVYYFQKLYVCHLGPQRYALSRGKERTELWKTTFFFGQWVKNATAGGSSRSGRHRNPQYRIEFELIEDGANQDGYVTAIVELTQRYKPERRDIVNVRFYIYWLNIVRNPPKPLDENFIKINKALNENDVSFSKFDANHRSRTYTARFKLEPGKYCIIPCTENENQESQFMLRVFSESRTDMWEYDSQISKSYQKEEEFVSAVSDSLKQEFYDIADKRDEIDYISLKKILQKSIDTNKSSFDMIKQGLFGLVKNVLGIFIPSISLSDLGTDEVSFSKDACRSMIAIFDDDRSGKLNFTEFTNLWNKIDFWTKVYNHHIAGTEGSLPVSQIRDALSSIGFDVNKRILNVLINFYANEREQISLSDFILCGVTLETGISLLQKRDVASDEKITFTLEKWVRNTLFL